MIEYLGNDKKELADACATLIKKCTSGKGNSIEMTLQFGDLFLDCRFEFAINKEHSSNRFETIKE